MNDKPRISDRDEEAIQLIADRVAAVLRAQVEELAARLIAGNGSDRTLTVGEVAERFGIARSTVYAHWREWGGYKLGEGDKAAIRFVPAALPTPEQLPPSRPVAVPDAPRRRRDRGRAVVRGEPRMPTELDGRI